MTVSEMVASNPMLQHHKRTLLKCDYAGKAGIRSVQILGTNPKQMAEAAKINVARGAHIIDINMGCPAKKVCSVAAGSALLRDEELVKRILDAVVNAVPVPVTLKIRTGWDKQNKNAVTIAQLAEQAGIAALTVHGRTRACKFEGMAEHETVRLIKQTVNIPVIANGDITSPEIARQVLHDTGADAIMIGRAARGNPWLFQQIAHLLTTETTLPPPKPDSVKSVLLQHLEELYRFYGDLTAVRIARKHIAWYLAQAFKQPNTCLALINQAETPAEQIGRVLYAFDSLTNL